MPPLSAAPIMAFQRFSISFVDYTGKSASTAIEAGANSTVGQRDTMQVELGSLSNARIMNYELAVGVRQVNPANPANTAFDEAFPEVKDALILVFQNDAGDVQTVRVPAPDAQFFLADGETVIVPSAAGSASQGFLLDAINAVLAVLNADDPAGTYAYARGYRENARRRVRTPLPLAEPVGVDQPGALPG